MTDVILKFNFKFNGRNESIHKKISPFTTSSVKHKKKRRCILAAAM